MIRNRRALTALAVLVALAAASASADDVSPVRPDAWITLLSIRPDPELQKFLDATLEQRLANDKALRRQTVRVAVIDLPAEGPGRLAHRAGDFPVYPASVVKFVYLMAAYAWQDRGRLTIDPTLDRNLGAMIHVSSNRATQHVLRRLTDTPPGPRLDPEGYADFRERRHRVKRWLQEMGIEGLHAVHPTYNGGGDIYGRDLQFLEDATVEGSLPNQTGAYRNRQAMTANDTARLLALLARDAALSPESSATVRERMRRDPRKQPYLVRRIAGGADGRKDLEVFSKTGTWGPIYADAGIVRHASGHEIVVVVFLEGRPTYHGSFIAQLTRAVVGHVLPATGAASASVE